MNNKYKYKAYISYSHCDERWATWLHRASAEIRALIENNRAVFEDHDTVLGVGFDGLGEDFLFEVAAEGNEIFDAVAVVDVAAFLGDDRAMVHLFVNKVHGYARERDAVGKSLLDGICPRKCWEQCGVDVDNCIRKPFDDHRRKDAHESRKHKNLGAVPLCGVTNRCRE